MRRVRVRSPGRVNLIGEHTDYNAGLAAPMAVDRAVDVLWRAADTSVITVASDIGEAVVEIPLGIAADRAALEAIAPGWARLAASVVALVRPASGGSLSVTSTLPTGVGLSSSAAYCVGLALALGAPREPWGLAALCRDAESAVGAPVGLMDPLVCLAGRAGHFLRVDFAANEYRAVPLPVGVAVAVVDSGVTRQLGATPYAERRAECEAAAALLGAPLGLANAAAVSRLEDETLRARARHVTSECDRVERFVAAIEAVDLVTAGALMNASHRSLTEDFAASTPQIDALVEALVATEGVFGARLCGGGFGGNVVALCQPGALSGTGWTSRSTELVASDGAVRVEVEDNEP